MGSATLYQLAQRLGAAVHTNERLLEWQPSANGGAAVERQK